MLPIARRDLERLASGVVLMEAMQHYFDYVFVGICGIPQVTLTGTLADWEKILDRAQHLARYGLSFWTRHLVPICKHFVRACPARP